MSTPEALASPPLSTPWVPLWPLAPTTLGELAYGQLTADATITATSEGAAAEIVSAPPVTLDGATPIVIEFASYHVNVDTATRSVYLSVWDGSTCVAYLAAVYCADAGGGVPVSARMRLTPAAGTHAYSIRAHLSGPGTGRIYAGTGVGGNFQPAFIRVSLAAPTAAPVSNPTYGTSFPASPANGQEHILVDSVTAPTYQWRFRYNASSTSPYKWEFVGGAPRSAYVQTQEGASLNTYSDLATVGPTVTTPRAGDYQIEFGAMFVQNGSSGVHGYASVAIGAAAAADGDAAGYASMGNGVLAGGPARQLVKTGLAAATPLKMQYRGSAAVPWLFRERRISILPVRVS